MQENRPETAELNLEWYTGSQGYDPQFLGPQVDLPTMSPELSLDKVPLSDGSGYELRYTHFSVVMSKSRKLAIFTAVNIDGRQLQDMPRGRDVWYFDPRIEREYHMDPRVYEHPDLDRGHLIRRLDPVWGEEAEEANEDTFHFTNCSPQHRALNRRTWLGLERYILDNAQVHELRVTVFTGPVFRDDDEIYSGEFAIPAEFWKVVAIVKPDGHLSATGYLQSQRDLVTDLEAFSFGEYKTYQVPLSYVETITALDFGELRHHDPLMPTEEIAPQAQVVEGPNDIVL
ncbi:MAG: DNA/RNA non-specific endonuclease [Anaerolineae bacterium]|nr:DNA/RNA non-specific endonuclease [Anaerolineae bacterium]